jgi:C4-type Zn-finger protein
MKTQPCIELNDLRFVCVTCPVCKTQLKLDLAVKILGDGDRVAFMPKLCGVCGHEFDSMIQRGLEEFYKVRQALMQITKTIIVFEGEPRIELPARLEK